MVIIFSFSTRPRSTSNAFNYWHTKIISKEEYEEAEDGTSGDEKKNIENRFRVYYVWMDGVP